jgi:hypothetical protein
LEFRPRETLSDDLTFEGTSLDHRNPFVVGGQAGLPLLVSEKWTGPTKEKKAVAEREKFTSKL